MTDIEGKIIGIVAKETRRGSEEISLDLKVEDIESLDLVQIIFAIEDEFQIYVPQDDEGFKLETLRDVVEGVQSLIAQKQASA